MKITELTKLLKAGEWNDVELKESRLAVPKSAFETVSAFPNTHGWRLVFGDDSPLFEPGEKEVRSPAIAMAMRRIAMCEQAGTGMRMMREEWQKLGHPAPTRMTAPGKRLVSLSLCRNTGSRIESGRLWAAVKGAASDQVRDTQRQGELFDKSLRRRAGK